jgi:class 3 adenylate cyclase
MSIRYAKTQERQLLAPPELVWGLVADSNRWDRLVGLNPTQYRYGQLEAGGEQVRARFGRATQSWGEAEWLERGEWVEGRFIHGMRRYVSGPFRVGGFRAEFSPAGGGVRTAITAYVEAEKALDAELERRVTEAFERALRHYFDALEQLFAGASEKGWLSPSSAPAAIQARQLLGRSEPDGSAFGLRGRVQDGELRHRAQRFEGAPVSPGLRERIVRFIQEGFDDELSRIRPFELARTWGVDRRELLRGFLYAAKAGLYELQWELECPMCRGGSQELSHLEHLQREGYCLDCDRPFSLDFASNVEAIFKASPAVRALGADSWCVASPWFEPHVLANFIVPPRERREVTLELPKGAYTLRTRMVRYRTGLPSHAGSFQVRLEPQVLQVTPGEGAAGDSRVTLVLVNDTPHEEEFAIERADWAPEAVLGRDVLAVREFHDLFSTEAPATGVELTIGSMAVLFSDLTGSTELYERLGDSRAFALIEQHFRIAARVVEQHGGAVLKTMGDAVMATFPRAGDAFSAALELVRQTERLLASEPGIRVKVGLHEGPCLAVRANQRLDLFGSTVNLAARLQGEAKGRQVVVLEGLLLNPDLRDQLELHRLEVSRFEAQLRGVAQRQSCLAVTVR